MYFCEQNEKEIFVFIIGSKHDPKIPKMFFIYLFERAKSIRTSPNKTKDQLWSLNAAQPVGNMMFYKELWEDPWTVLVTPWDGMGTFQARPGTPGLDPQAGPLCLGTPLGLRTPPGLGTPLVWGTLPQSEEPIRSHPGPSQTLLS